MSDSETTALPRAVLNEGGRRTCEDRCGLSRSLVRPVLPPRYERQSDDYQ